MHHACAGALFVRIEVGYGSDTTLLDHTREHSYFILVAFFVWTFNWSVDGRKGRGKLKFEIPGH